jgi:hypothetical protein
MREQTRWLHPGANLIRAANTNALDSGLHEVRWQPEGCESCILPA